MLKTALPKNDYLKCLILRVYFWYSLNQRQSRKAIATWVPNFRTLAVDAACLNQRQSRKAIATSSLSSLLPYSVMSCLNQRQSRKAIATPPPDLLPHAAQMGSSVSQSETKPKGYCDPAPGRVALCNYRPRSQSETKPKGYCDQQFLNNPMVSICCFVSIRDKAERLLRQFLLSSHQGFIKDASQSETKPKGYCDSPTKVRLRSSFEE